VLTQKANHFDDIIETRDSSSLCCPNVDKPGASASDPIAYTCTLDKAYSFFKDGHVQNVRYHPLRNSFD